MCLQSGIRKHFSLSLKKYYDNLCNVCEKSSEIARKFRYGLHASFGRSFEIMWKRCTQGGLNATQDFRVICYENVKLFKTEPLCWTVCEQCSRVWLETTANDFFVLSHVAVSRDRIFG